MTPFDLAAISDEGLRREYGFLQERAGNIGRSLSAAYGAGRKPIVFRFIDEKEFNAYAGEEEDAYTVELNASIPLFVIILFARLLSNEKILPYLDASGSKASDFSLPAVVDPSEFDKRAEWTIALNGVRAFAASTIGDICSTFIICHEFGHIVNGHVEAIRHYEKKSKVAELVSRSRVSRLASTRQQAWEYDADAVAASLMIQFIDQLVDVCKSNERARLVFARGDGHDLEHTLAITIAALFGLFSYIQGMRHRLKKDASHPHPIVRAHYLKDMLFALVRNRAGFDDKLFHDLLDTRLDEILEALQDVNLFEGRIWSSAYQANIELELARLSDLQHEQRLACARWSWIELDRIA